MYEGVANGDDYSGTFISNYLIENGIVSSYRNYIPQSLKGFSSIFLSYGFWESGSTALDDNTSDIIIDYLQSGGYVYIEGGDVFGWDQADNDELHELFGLESSVDGSINDINYLQGQDDALTTGLVFTGNSQLNNLWIDKFTPNANGIVAFDEQNYGTVAVQNSIPDAHRTFCFSYALAYLDDGEELNNREELLERILNFFGSYVSVPHLEESNVTSCNVYPNPMNSEAIFEYTLSEDSYVVLEVFSALGTKVMQAINANQQPGTHQLQLDVEELQSGIYYYSLDAGINAYTGKIMVLK